MIPREAITGLVLAGGAGRRMGGQDKGLVDFRGIPLALHALRRLQAQTRQPIISANRNLERYQTWGVPVITDAFHEPGGGFAGPLAGIAAALAVIETPWLLTVPCDVPWFPEDLAQRLGTTHAKLAIANGAGRMQPLLALIHRELVADLEGFLQTGGRPVRAWQARHAPAVASFTNTWAFANANDRNGLAAMEKA